MTDAVKEEFINLVGKRPFPESKMVFGENNVHACDMWDAKLEGFRLARSNGVPTGEADHLLLWWCYERLPWGESIPIPKTFYEWKAAIAWQLEPEWIKNCRAAQSNGVSAGEADRRDEFEHWWMLLSKTHLMSKQEVASLAWDAATAQQKETK